MQIYFAVHGELSTGGRGWQQVVSTKKKTLSTFPLSMGTKSESLLIWALHLRDLFRLSAWLKFNIARPMKKRIV